MSEHLNYSEIEPQKPVEASTICEFNEWGLKGDWLKLSDSEGNSVEGASYKPTSANGEAVVFHPGLPGEGIVTFEEKFVRDLLEQGYEVFAARHNGLKNQESNAQLLHNTTRSNFGPISGDPFSWFAEPKVSIDYFAQQDKPISLITHSFSGIAVANSFIELAEKHPNNNPAEKVKKWVLASGSVWNLSPDGTLDPDRDFDTKKLKQYCEYFADLYDLQDEDAPNRLLERIQRVLQRISDKVGNSVPASTEVVGIYPEADKLVSPNVGINLINRLPRGIVLRDNFRPEDNEDLHEFGHAEASNLLRILRMKTSTYKHTFDINRE